MHPRSFQKLPKLEAPGTKPVAKQTAQITRSDTVITTKQVFQTPGSFQKLPEAQQVECSQAEDMLGAANMHPLSVLIPEALNRVAGRPAMMSQSPSSSAQARQDLTGR